MEDSGNITVWGVGTPRTLRVHWALHEVDVPYAIVPVQTRTAAMHEDDFLAVSPGRKIPAFQHGDLSLAESGAITRYVMANFSDERWSAQECAYRDYWTFFALTELDATALYVLRRHQGLPAIYGEAPTAVAAAYAYLDRQLVVLDRVLADGRACLLGERFSEADIHTVSCLDWAALVDAPLPPAAAGYRERLHQRPAYAAACRANETPL